ncbi:MAG: Putative cell wall associated biofilm protein [uncultured Sulfurovum sp.]|uniref:Cell wall associated biofilm protein n=1 Tax=uncultured Sulfurovum sp. TaxID=269237 RepID=A0A6S6SWM3_9BACT|nr:MAG: Putative cell wall associated biofilm protein [uncultured Sulfurovum sp.]
MNSVGQYTVTYNATDDSNNHAVQVTRTVIVQDSTKPIITLLGANPQILELGSSYTELNALTNDGSPITINSSNVNMNSVGQYTVTYNATDDSNNHAVQVTRTVIVQDSTNIPILKDIDYSSIGMKENELFSYQLELIQGQNVSYQVYSNPPSNISVNNSGLVSWIATGVNTYTVTARAFNISGESIDTWTIVIDPANNIPVLSVDENIFVLRNSNKIIKISKSDADTHDYVNINIIESPTYGTLVHHSEDSEYTELKYIPNDNYLGKDQFVVMGDDGYGGLVELKIILTVVETLEKDNYEWLIPTVYLPMLLSN